MEKIYCGRCGGPLEEIFNISVPSLIKPEVSDFIVLKCIVCDKVIPITKVWSLCQTKLKDVKDQGDSLTKN